MNITASASWKAIEAHRLSLSPVHLRQLFASDPGRVASLSLSYDGILYDFSKQRMDSTTLALLVGLAREARLDESTDRMFSGEKINASEDRSVLHVALRRSIGPFPGTDLDVMPEVLATRQRMAAFADRIRSGQMLGFTGMPIRHVVNIGIGGSDLGPKMLDYALRSISHPALGVHYVSNLDGAQLAPLLQTLDPRTTLFLVASKTFTTQETMLNAQTARDWLVANLGDANAVSRHFAALTAKPERAVKFGIKADAVFPLWDWVGGRFSLWSAVGLALMIAIGPHAFADLLAGAERMDEHFRSTPYERNLPVVMALIGIWNTNFLGATSNAVLPYNESLKYFPSFLQQLEMESNGKSVGSDGQPLACASNPIVWGELGNNGQHAFFQLLHQGGRLVPCDFIAAVRSDYPLPGHQEALLANCFAQSAALAFGKTAEEARSELNGTMPEAELASLLPHKVFAGNQPSSTLLLSRLDPQTLGALIALYEHKVFVQGVIWGLNSFDQWGVELGKAVASSILPAIANPLLAEKLDASTQGLLAFSRQHLA
ncbi:MAG: Glucose-6-phosphate isomerase [Candidatus Accumulibacter phosphatis]|uniref:Glucose-6-phosphate isomerase n=1 Tax=Candidatus Accumulibacter phosphatis TaxID=327160 RepID=A0A080LVX9_9PROT|nr:glucose-6-phosphate isomerase [Accumulibacter sp.]KFB71875.1 MAG: Glucose-6-phosphate isomerase [Candidatus Accumulibacter phosphatis]HRF10682.1 glucose-6-phosphate isomerase [Candidatus Accumulibacter phosphatis]